MANDPTTREPLSLWDCLHDGLLEGINHDALARTLTLIVDVPYIWTFHDLPEETRFELLLHDVVRMQALEYQFWPGAQTIPNEMPYEQQQAERLASFAKGSQTSRDWFAFLKSVTRDPYDITDASIEDSPSGSVIAVDLSNYGSNDYVSMRLDFGRLSISLRPERTLSLQEFLAMGAAYWEDFANRSPTIQPAAQA